MGQMVTTVQSLGRKEMEDRSFSTLAEEQDPDILIDRYQYHIRTNVYKHGGKTPNLHDLITHDHLYVTSSTAQGGGGSFSIGNL